jgi:hypothetical protein
MRSVQSTGSELSVEERERLGICRAILKAGVRQALPRRARPDPDGRKTPRRKVIRPGTKKQKT